MKPGSISPSADSTSEGDYDLLSFSSSGGSGSLSGWSSPSTTSGSPRSAFMETTHTEGLAFLEEQGRGGAATGVDGASEERAPAVEAGAAGPPEAEAAGSGGKGAGDVDEDDLETRMADLETRMAKIDSLGEQIDKLHSLSSLRPLGNWSRVSVHFLDMALEDLRDTIGFNRPDFLASNLQKWSDEALVDRVEELLGELQMAVDLNSHVTEDKEVLTGIMNAKVFDVFQMYDFVNREAQDAIVVEARIAPTWAMKMDEMESFREFVSFTCAQMNIGGEDCKSIKDGPRSGAMQS